MGADRTEKDGRQPASARCGLERWRDKRHSLHLLRGGSAPKDHRRPAGARLGPAVRQSQRQFDQPERRQRRCLRSVPVPRRLSRQRLSCDLRPRSRLRPGQVADGGIPAGRLPALRRVVRAYDQGAVAPINRAVEPGRDSGREPRPTDTHTHNWRPLGRPFLHSVSVISN